MFSHILGFPRIGVRRELKKALEAYWAGPQDEAAGCTLRAVADGLKVRHWALQREAGLSAVATGDFSLYDHILDATAMLGLVPARYGWEGGAPALRTYFHMARGDAGNNIPAMEMTKWFDTNYHYIVPEFYPGQQPALSSRKIIDDTRLAATAGFSPKPVLVGPLTYLTIGKEYDGADRWALLPQVLAVYKQVLKELAPLAEWIQLDEPILATDLPPLAREHFAATYQELNRYLAEVPGGRAKLLLAGYFGALEENLPLALGSGCGGLHLDLVRGGADLPVVLKGLPAGMVLSAGLVEGRNIWRTDLKKALVVLQAAIDAVGPQRVMVASSCSLQHSPVDVREETALDPQIRGWLAFAVQKCREVALLAQAASGGQDSPQVQMELAENADAIASRRAHPQVLHPEIRNRALEVTPAMLCRKSAYLERKPQQQAWLNLPLLPTTTIGSFPQTPQIRNARKGYADGKLSLNEYRDFLREEVRMVIKRQEGLGLDVLVHGEPERNDMVEYFGQQLEGFAFTKNGWVQSYGSRCVKPPFIFGDVSRPKAMTVEWATFAAQQSQKPVKGMLTGPVTILCWSFVRDDLPRAEVCRQIGLAIRDEVQDLEKAGIRVIQIDEAALREGMPLRQRDREGYLNWAVDSFRLAVSGVEDATQIHTHMCYSEFNAIIAAIARMDADVISIESSRSKMELLDAFREFEYPNEIGPGVYDIHSPRVPSVEEMVDLLRRALKVVPAERLWVNPDCGLKTRGWPECLQALQNMVQAAALVRAELTTG